MKKKRLLEISDRSLRITQDKRKILHKFKPVLDRS